jgi:serine/threonine-protein kinase RsbW
VPQHWSASEHTVLRAQPDVKAGHVVLRRQWTIVSDILEIEPLVSDAVEVCAAAGVGARQCSLHIPVALTEALSNAIVRGNHSERTRRVIVSLRLDATTLALEVTDEGDGFDPEAATFSPDDADWLEREDGRGLFLMRSLMDAVELQRPTSAGQGHTVRMVLNRP